MSFEDLAFSKYSAEVLPAVGAFRALRVDTAGPRHHNTGRTGIPAGEVFPFDFPGKSRRLSRFGGVPEWLKGTDCKSVGLAYVGSNPTPSTSFRNQMSGVRKSAVSMVT